MGKKKKKISKRRQHVRETMSAERLSRLNFLADSKLPWALLILLVFAVLTIVLVSVDSADQRFFRPNAPVFKPISEVSAITSLVLLVTAGMALYLYHYQRRICERPTRMIAITGLFLGFMIITKTASTLWPEWIYLATGSTVAVGIILTIAYSQRFAIGMTIFYGIYGCFAVDRIANMELFLTMIVGGITCCYSLREIRTRGKVLEVATLRAAPAVFLTSAAMIALTRLPLMDILRMAGSAAIITVAVGFVVEGFLPLIERLFGIATSMTLLDYSDANQPLLKKLAMEAPGTFSHSLLIGSIAEAAADAIGANGLLCRVGAYYHDIGKINKPPYFGENQMGQASRHEQLSPAMSQLVIVGHVKDGIEIAREYGLPAVLRQFIETHHGTTLIEYFYDQAKKKQSEKGGPAVSESEFRYPGPRPQTKESAIVMLADTCESAVRSLSDPTPTKIEAVVHNMSMKRLQDGQFDDCDLTLRQLHQIEAAITKNLAAYHHGRVAYPKAPDQPDEGKKGRNGSESAKAAKAGNGAEKPSSQGGNGNGQPAGGVNEQPVKTEEGAFKGS